MHHALRTSAIGRTGIAGAVAMVVALAAVVGAPPAIGGATVEAATPGLTLVTASHYDVQPAEKKVAISSRITAANHLHDTKTKRYFFRTAYLAVLPSTSHFHLSGSGRPKVAVSKRTPAYTLLRLDLGANLAAGSSRTLTLTFDLTDPGGAPDRPIRISPSLVSFYAWAFATSSTAGSSISITFPPGYTVSIGRGPLRGPTIDATEQQTWTSGPLDNPLAFVADVSADRPATYVETTDVVRVGASEATLELRAWPDDPGWRDRVSDLLDRGLPVLSTELGLPWPSNENPLIVQEALVRSTGGYAGLFDPSQRRIEIAYAASTSVVLHEAAHAWLNGSLLADRWAAEAFASYYAERAAAELKVKVSSPELTDAERQAAIPLNAWGIVGSEPAETESFAYAASLAVARSIAERAGDAGLRQVWAQISAGEPAYQPPSGPHETGAAAPDWRGLLDLLEDNTSASYVDLWRTWVVRPEDAPALEARAAARTAYHQAIVDAGSWALPASIRSALRSWSFDVATRQLADVETLLDQRDALQGQAASAGLELPATLRADVEAGRLADAATEASIESATIQAITSAAAARPAQLDMLQTLGLVGTTPDADLAAARNSLAAGDLAAAAGAAATARADWTSAGDLGRGRVLAAALLALAIVLFAGLLFVRRRRATVPVASSEPETSESDDPDPLHSRP